MPHSFKSFVLLSGSEAESTEVTTFGHYYAISDLLSCPEIVVASIIRGTPPHEQPIYISD
jgi:hypothetical protein